VLPSTTGIVIGTNTRISWSAARTLICQNAKATGSPGTQGGGAAAATSPAGLITSTATEIGTTVSWRTRSASNAASASPLLSARTRLRSRVARAAAECASGAAAVSTGGRCGRLGSSAAEPSGLICAPRESGGGRFLYKLLNARVLHLPTQSKSCSIHCISRADVVSS